MAFTGNPWLNSCIIHVTHEDRSDGNTGQDITFVLGSSDLEVCAEVIRNADHTKVRLKGHGRMIRTTKITLPLKQLRKLSAHLEVDFKYVWANFGRIHDIKTQVSSVSGGYI